MKIELKLSRSGFVPQSTSDVEDLISDWVGVKITCNTSSDAPVVINKLSALCERDGNPTFATKDNKPDVADYIKSPKHSGYRAYHTVLLVPAHYRAEPCTVRVQVQIKTRLQDAWGRADPRKLLQGWGAPGADCISQHVGQNSGRSTIPHNLAPT